MADQPDRSPVISLIMPVWRPHPAWLPAAVTSALGQDGCDLELLVVDDGCDRPVEDALSTVHDRRLRYLRIAHGGQAAALNAGIAAARGRWLRFVDADDVLPPGSTRRLADLLDGDRVIVYGSTLVCDEALQGRRTIASTVQGDAATACLLGRFDVRHVSMLFPRRVVDAAGSWDTAFKVSADWDFVLRALDHAQVRGDAGIVTLYRRHRQSVSRRADVAAGEESRRRMIARYFERHPEQRGTSLERQAWSAAYLDRGFAYWNARQYRASASRLARALRTEPVPASIETARFFARRVRRPFAARPPALQST